MTRKTPIKQNKALVRKNKPADKNEMVSEIDYTSMSTRKLKKLMTSKQIMFCHYYIRDWNGLQACVKAGYSKRTAGTIANQNLNKLYINEYIKRIQDNIAKEVGISKIGLLTELKAMATSNMFHLFDGDWLKKTKFDDLIEKYPELTKAIQEVSTKTVCTTDAEKEPINIEYVKLKLYDKQRAIEAIFKAMGWNAAEKLEVSTDINMNINIKQYSVEQKHVLLEMARKNSFE